MLSANLCRDARATLSFASKHLADANETVRLEYQPKIDECYSLVETKLTEITERQQAMLMPEAMPEAIPGAISDEETTSNMYRDAQRLFMSSASLLRQIKSAKVKW